MTKRIERKKPSGVPKEAWEAVLESFEARRVTGKGWRVTNSKKNKKFPYCGFAVRNGERIKDGLGTPYWPTQAMAVQHAIAHAHLNGTLDWSKTHKWLKLMRIEVDMNEMLVHRVYNSKKGWYLSTATNRLGATYSTVVVGPSDEFSQYFCIGATPRSAIKKAFKIGLKNEPYYDEESSIVWLIRNGYKDLIELAKKEKAA